MSYGYGPERSWFENQNTTGLEQVLSQQRRDLLMASETNQINRLKCQVERLENEIDELNRKLNTPVPIYKIGSIPEPSVEIIDHTLQGALKDRWLSRWLSNVKDNTALDFFRPIP